MEREKKMRWNYILFDLDGTLLDTSAGIQKSVEHTLHELSLPKLSPEHIRTFVGPPINRSLQGTFHLTDEQTQVATNLFRTLYKDKYLFEAAPYPGVYELLKKLREAGCQLGVATYKRDDYAHQLLDYFNLTALFDQVQGCDAESKWSKADIIQQVLERMGCTDKAQAVLVGDTVHDYTGAKQCGIHFAAVGYGFGFTPAERESLPEVQVYCEDAQQLWDYLKGD